MTFRPVLSVVATSRNDNHGGNALWRTQHFVNGLAAQAKKHQLAIELVLVDWNPPAENPPLFDALKWSPNEFFHVRVIEVPATYHFSLPHADKMGLFQYIAKNVGIRRAKGEFILATNIDILFSDPLMLDLKKGLQKGILYRVDRYDMEADIKDEWSFEQILTYAHTHVIRINGKWGTIPNTILMRYFGVYFYVLLKFLEITFLYPFRKIRRSLPINHQTTIERSSSPSIGEKRTIAFEAKKYFLYLERTFLDPVHTSACGDFTLLSKEDWEKLQGYPEWPQYSWHIDSVLVYQAHHMGITVKALPTDHCIYHIEHGQGWTPETERALFAKLQKKGLPYMDDHGLEKAFHEQRHLKKQGKPIIYTSTDWGAASENFLEKQV